MSYFGDQVRQLREGNGWSQGELAHRAGIDKQTVFRIEQGANTRRGTMVRIAEALSVSLGRLMDEPHALDGARGSDRNERVEDRLSGLLGYIKTLEGSQRSDFIRAVVALLHAIEHARPAASSGAAPDDER